MMNTNCTEYTANVVLNCWGAFCAADLQIILQLRRCARPTDKLIPQCCAQNACIIPAIHPSLMVIYMRARRPNSIIWGATLLGRSSCLRARVCVRLINGCARANVRLNTYSQIGTTICVVGHINEELRNSGITYCVVGSNIV